MRLVLVFYDWVPKGPEFGTKPNLFFLNEIFFGLPSLQEHKPYSRNDDGIPDHTEEYSKPITLKTLSVNKIIGPRCRSPKCWFFRGGFGSLVLALLPLVNISGKQLFPG